MITRNKPAADGTQWKVDFPNGSSKTFAAEWQAHHAVSMAGGKVTRVTKGPSRSAAANPSGGVVRRGTGRGEPTGR